MGASGRHNKCMTTLALGAVWLAFLAYIWFTDSETKERHLMYMWGALALSVIVALISWGWFALTGERLYSLIEQQHPGVHLLVNSFDILLGRTALYHFPLSFC